jgi:NAD(P)-dependent dehydrogenase (short-subunit alcohol dehydrogenase family)
MSDAPFRLDGKVALVTGAARGIGAAIAASFARSGADLALTDLPGVDLGGTAAKVAGHGRRVLQVAIDVTDLAQIRQGVAAAQHELGRIDILVNNAGINRPAVALDVTEADWDATFATNVKGGFFMAQAVVPGMIERGWGRIVFIASQAGLVCFPNIPAYCASKGAVVNLVRALGIEWAAHGITVNAVAPTVVETDLTRDRLEHNAEYRDFVYGKLPGGKVAQPEDVAAAVVYLASDEAAMVNAAILRIDGGWTAW